MGTRTTNLVIVILIAASLVVLAVQNSSSALGLIFLGFRTMVLPLGVWLSGAIALGALSAIALFALTGDGTAPTATRRRWTVRPDGAAPNDERPNRSPSQNFRSPSPGAAPRATPSDAPARPPSSPSGKTGDRATTEDWQTWGQRTSPRQWEDWPQTDGSTAAAENLSRRERKERQQMETAIKDLDQGWDASAQEVVYVAPRGSDVEDALDEIADGWEDWDSADNPLADTAYAQRYDGVARKARRDAVYAPPDDEGEADEGVYDADYRVIIPPYRPTAAPEDDRTP